MTGQPCKSCAPRIELLEALVRSKTPAGITQAELQQLREVATGNQAWVAAEQYHAVCQERNKLSRQLQALKEQQAQEPKPIRFHALATTFFRTLIPLLRGIVKGIRV